MLNEKTANGTNNRIDESYIYGYSKLFVYSLCISGYSIGATIYIIFLLTYCRYVANQNSALYTDFAKVQRDLINGTKQLQRIDKEISLFKVQGCGEGWRYFSKTNSCYLSLRITTKSYTSAENWCQDLGGHLASIHSEEENEFIYTLRKEGHYCTWIGLKLNTETGEYGWSDGSAFDFQRWAEGEPNGRDQGEEAAWLYLKTSATHKQRNWNDFPAEDHYFLPTVITCKSKSIPLFKII